MIWIESAQTLGVSQERWNRYIEMMVDVGYIKGVKIKEYQDGEIVVVDCGIRITLKGLEYLQENSIMQRMYSAAKGIADLVP